MSVYDLLEIPSDPRDAVRERVCALLARENPGDPRTAPDRRRIITGWRVVTALQFVAVFGWAACLWWAAS